jgi:3-methyladenine DNA glycosylase/8-oxoguanine DNA glycosylase
MFTEKHRVEFSAVPPYNFELTVHKPAGWWWATPNEVFQNGVLWTTARLNSHLYGLRLNAAGNIRKPAVSCNIFSSMSMKSQEKDDLTQTVERALGVKEDLGEFYVMASKDKILRELVKDLFGMRTMAWPELFPALVLAVTLQMAPMKRSNQMMELLIKNFGDEICFDGKTIVHWPSPEKIAGITVEELKTKAKLGYRAQNLVSIAQRIREGFPTVDDLANMPIDEAKKVLMTLQGIGDYSADLVVPGMGFPLDVWSAKIFSILLFGKEPESPERQSWSLRKRPRSVGESGGGMFLFMF